MRKYFGFVIILPIFLFFSCATTLKMEVIRPAELDLNGAKSIGIVPFSHSDRFPFYSSLFSQGSEFDSYLRVSAVEQQVLNFIYSELERGLVKSPYVELVSGNLVQDALRGQGVNPADVYISGEMVTFNIFDDEKGVKKELGPEDYVISSYFDDVNGTPSNSESVNKKSRVIIEYFYTREVLLVFNYQVVDGASGNVLYFNTLKINRRCDPVDSVKKLPDPYSMIDYDLHDFVSSFMKKLQPYSVTRSVALLKDKSENPDMERAYKMAENGALKESYKIFYDIYNSLGLFEAGYNAAMVMMVLGDFQGAEKLMREIYVETGNIKASEGLSDIMGEIRQRKILERQQGEGKGFVYN